MLDIIWGKTLWALEILDILVALISQCNKFSITYIDFPHTPLANPRYVG